jgi:hypothetical protein
MHISLRPKELWKSDRENSTLCIVTARLSKNRQRAAQGPTGQILAPFLSEEVFRGRRRAFVRVAVICSERIARAAAARTQPSQLIGFICNAVTHVPSARRFSGRFFCRFRIFGDFWVRLEAWNYKFVASEFKVPAFLSSTPLAMVACSMTQHTRLRTGPLMTILARDCCKTAFGRENVGVEGNVLAADPVL